MLAPVLERLRKELGSEVSILDVDIDVQGNLAHRFDVEAIPTLVFLKNGQPVGRSVGAKSETTTRKWILECGKSSTWKNLMSVIKAISEH